METDCFLKKNKKDERILFNIENNNLLNIYKIDDQVAIKLGSYKFSKDSFINGVEGFKIVNESSKEVEMLAILVRDSNLVLQF